MDDDRWNTTHLRQLWQLYEKKLTQKARDALPESAFVFPDRRAFPIHDLEHGKIALQFAESGFRIKKSDIPIVKAAVFKRYPELKKKKAKKESIMGVLEQLEQISEQCAMEKPEGPAGVDLDSIKSTVKAVTKTDAFKDLVDDVADRLAEKIPEKQDNMAGDFERLGSEASFMVARELGARVAFSMLSGSDEAFEGFEIKDDGLDGDRFVEWAQTVGALMENIPGGVPTVRNPDSPFEVPEVPAGAGNPQTDKTGKRISAKGGVAKPRNPDSPFSVPTVPDMGEDLDIDADDVEDVSLAQI